MDFQGTRVLPVMPRQASGAAETPGQLLLDLVKNPFASALVSQSIWASLGTSIGFTVLIAIAFSFLRPYNSVVYAPKLKHADEKHAPPPMGKGVFAWVSPLVKTKEHDLIPVIGMDATIFLRFTRMLRNMFVAIAVLGCGILIPINLRLGTSQTFQAKTSYILALTPQNTFGKSNYGMVICAWLFQAIVLGLLWWNYRKILALRRHYFDSPEYQNSLHSRTLMLNDIPKQLRSDEGISRLIDEVAPSSSFCRSATARNVKDLPELIKEHSDAVRELEKVLAKYLQNPDQLPASRPMCKPSKKDPSWGSYPRGQKVDAIEYLTDRIRALELEIKEMRLGIDKRNALPYGFASYEDISEAHSIAYSARKKAPQGTTIVLAPRPHDVIWNNMPLSRSTRRWRRIVNNMWISLLTLIWVVPNIAISIFLVNLTNLGAVWPAFKTSLERHTGWWAIVQGVASPALTSLIYLVLPIIFRRLANRAGDRTKTSRERHVTGKLYTFFIFNNLIVFTFFSTLWEFISKAIDITRNENVGAWEAIKEAELRVLIFNSICNISPFWVTWLLQRNLGAAVDLAQMWTLVYSFCARKFSSPTPRELIELTAPPPFDYASYYNYFLFYATVTLCYATVQPLVLPAAALYFALDVFLKKYLLLYIFITKTESGGMFWRTIFNRIIFATILSNCVVFFVLIVHGDAFPFVMAWTVAPLPFIAIGFKIYCRKAFDDKMHYYTTQSNTKDVEANKRSRFTKGDRLASRYGHPALYKSLITPMVHARAQNILASVYGGRLSDPNNENGDASTVSGYSDMYALDPMRTDKPGRAVSGKKTIPGFEMVPENKLDFSYYKNRSEFGEEHGQDSLYTSNNQTPDPYDRPGTSHTFHTGYGSDSSSRPGSPAQGMGVPRRKEVGSPLHDQTMGGGLYEPEGNPYHSQSNYHAQNDVPSIPNIDSHNNGRFYSQQQYDASSASMPLVQGAAGPPMSPPPPSQRNRVASPPGGRMMMGERSMTGDSSGTVGGFDGRRAASPAPGFLGGGPRGYGGLPQEEETLDAGSYDYFRGTRGTGAPGEGGRGY